MLTSKKRPLQFVAMYCPAGVLIPRPPVGMRRPKWQRFYNWPRNEDGSPVEDYPGGPVGVEVVVMVPRDQYHGRMLARGPARLATDAEVKAYDKANAPAKPAAKPAKPKDTEG